MKVRLGKAATLEVVEQLKPDVVILATGGISIVPTITGVNRGNVVQAWDVLRGKKIGNRVVVIGGGMVGCDTADFLAKKGKTVTVVTRFPIVAQDMELSSGACSLIGSLSIRLRSEPTSKEER